MAIETITLSYNANGGSPKPPSQTAKYDPEINPYASLTVSTTRPKRTGYSFGSWGGYAPGSVIRLTASRTLKASWNELSYKVSFVADGATGVPAEQKKMYFSDLILPSETPTIPGKTFRAWNTAEDGSGTDYPAAAAYTANEAVTLYAQWEPAKYRVTFNANGGTGAPAAQSKIHDEDLQLPISVPSLVNMGFVAWDTEQAGTGTRYEPGSYYTANSDLTLYAVWEEGSTVSFNANGGSGVPAPQLKFPHQDLTLSNVTPARPGYTFDHWNTDPNDGGTNYLPGGSYTTNKEITLYAIWAANTYTITFSGSSSKQVVFGTEIGAMPSVSRTGYTFAGWRYGDEAWTPKTILTVPESVSLTAAWTPNKYTITFDADGGESPLAEIQVVYDAAIGDLPEPIREGYSFTGWTFGGSFITAETIYTNAADTEAVAAWLPNHYTVTYVPGEGTGTPFTQDIVQDVPWTANHANAFHKVGHHQSGWGSVKMGQVVSAWADMTLTATYSLSTFTMTIAGIGTKDIEYGSVIGHLPPLYRPGKQFVGWAVNGSPIKYDDKYLWDGNVTASPVYRDLSFDSASTWAYDKPDEPHVGLVTWKKEDGTMAIGKVFVAR